MVKFISGYLHSGVGTIDYWAVTRWFEFNLTLKKEVLGIKPFLRKVNHFLVDLFLLLGSLGLLILRLVTIQGLQHLSELLDLRFVGSLYFGFFLALFFGLLFIFDLGSRLSKFLYGLILLLISFFELLVFLCDFGDFTLNCSQVLIKLINLLI